MHVLPNGVSGLLWPNSGTILATSHNHYQPGCNIKQSRRTWSNNTCAVLSSEWRSRLILNVLNDSSRWVIRCLSSCRFMCNLLLQLNPFILSSVLLYRHAHPNGLMRLFQVINMVMRGQVDKYLDLIYCDEWLSWWLGGFGVLAWFWLVFVLG